MEKEWWELNTTEYWDEFPICPGYDITPEDVYFEFQGKRFLVRMAETGDHRLSISAMAQLVK